VIIRKVDAENDWRFGKGKSDYARDDQAIQQNVKTRVLSWVGDCFFAMKEGVDWRERLDVGQKDAMLDEVKGIILQSVGVVGINSAVVEFNETTRSIQITYDIETIFSQSFQGLIQFESGAV
jgi:hypothetical protein